MRSNRTHHQCWYESHHEHSSGTWVCRRAVLIYESLLTNRGGPSYATHEAVPCGACVTLVEVVAPAPTVRVHQDLAHVSTTPASHIEPRR
jgi:hypothetical protein